MLSEAAQEPRWRAGDLVQCPHIVFCSPVSPYIRQDDEGPPLKRTERNEQVSVILAIQLDGPHGSRVTMGWT